MKLALTALLAGSAAAFAPASIPKASTALNMAFENELGAQEPLGFYVSFHNFNTKSDVVTSISHIVSSLYFLGSIGTCH